MPSAVNRAINYLISAQQKTGGWGYKSGHRGVIEPSSLALLAIRDEPSAQETFQRGLTWILGCQHEDGGWGIHEDDSESGWQTVWALITLNLTRQDENSITRGTDWLTTVATYEVTHEEFLNPAVPQNNQIGALAWPWLPGQAAWTEPSALAVLALQGAVAKPLVNARVKASIDYFVQYRTSGGGWNVGNAGPLDTDVRARVYPTVRVLLALQRVAQQTILPEDISALEKDLKNDPGIMAQGAGSLALSTFGKTETGLLSNLSAQQLDDGSWENSPFATAWALIGMRGYL